MQPKTSKHAATRYANARSTRGRGNVAGKF